MLLERCKKWSKRGNMSETEKGRSSTKARDLVHKYKQTFSSPAGKEVLKDLMKLCHFVNTDCDMDPYVVSFKNGERSVLMRILSAVDMDLDLLRKMTDDIYQGETDEE